MRLVNTTKCSNLWDTKEDVILTYYVHYQPCTNQKIYQGRGFFLLNVLLGSTARAGSDTEVD